MNPHLFVLLLMVACAVPNSVFGQCILDYTTDFDLNRPPPVFTTNNQFMDPNTSGSITIAASADVVISCPGQNNYVDYAGPNANQMPKVDHWVARCVNGKTFKAFQTNFFLIQVACNKQPEVTIQNTMDLCEKKNNPDIRKYRVGYIVRGDMYTLYEVCFDTHYLTTCYVKKIVYPYSNLNTQPTKQKFQTNGMFNGVSMDNLYTKNHQKMRFDTIFGPTQTYTNTRALEKGHLVSRADCVMAAQVRATYQYINAGPQWNAVNAPRWASLEKAVRQYVSTNQSPAAVYTGTLAVLSLPKTSTTTEAVYLTTDAANTGIVPVPLYFYKMVEEPGKVMVFVTMNWDNTIDIPVNSLRLCNDPCGLNWNSGGILSFCCDYTRFVNIIGYNPNQ